MKKIYTAFISSEFESLRDERQKVIDKLLDFKIMPIAMEHFTVSSSGQFDEIKELIDDSDIFVLLMGKKYGSHDENGVSWSEREYEYAMLKKKQIIAIICDELIPNLTTDPASLSEEELKQVEFCKRIKFARNVDSKFSVEKILEQFLAAGKYINEIGWSRIENVSLTPEQIEEWRAENKVFDIGGLWYHVHLSDDDEKYIRIGKVIIEQDYSPDNYTSLHITGTNHNIDYYDSGNEKFKENITKRSEFEGDYSLKNNGKIQGIFTSKRIFNGEFNLVEVASGSRRGIHDFLIDVYSDSTDCIIGEFHDEAPSPKMGSIYLFRNKCDRDEFVLENRGNVIEMR